jgi:nucleoside-diphosphate-sugar epimerase
MAQEDFIKALLAASGHSAEIKHLPAWVIAAAGWCCESAWKVLKRKSEPPVTRFVASQLTTHHWFDISAAKEDFNYHPMVPIREGMRLLAESAHKPG